MHRNSFCARNSTQYSGISYQNVQPYDVIEQEHDTKPDENMLKHSGTNSSNRSFLMNELVLEPYRKKAKMKNSDETGDVGTVYGSSIM